MAGCGARFLCDEMLARLGRWLRAAGYDVVIARPGEEDGQLLKIAREEGRRLITRDRKLLEYRDAAAHVTLLYANRLPDQLEEFSRHYNVDWLCNPFSRCLECNSELVVAGAVERARVPPAARREDETVLYCASCDKVYWYGSHVRRMHRKLEQFAVGVWDANVEEEFTFSNDGKKE
jgi:hypothetical protein